MKKTLTLGLISLLISAIMISGIAYGQKSQDPSEGLDKYNWYDGDRKEQVFMSPDEVAIFTKNVQNKGDVAKRFDPKAVIIKDYDYLMIIQLPQKNTAPGLEDKIIRFNQDTGHRANLVFYKGDQKKDQAMKVLTGEIVAQFKNWDESAVSEWAKDNNVDVIKKFSFSPNTYLLDAGPGFKSINVANQLYESGNAVYSYPNWWALKYTRATPNDALFGNQWHLLNTGQGGGTSGEDVNIVSVWDTYKGSQNEVIAVVDDGVEIAHEDLSPNILGGYSYDYIDGNEDPTGGAHGTSVAGVAAARGFNSIGVTGAAPEGKIVGHRLLGANTDVNEADALTRNGNVIDIYTNSWGPMDDRHLEKPGPLTLSALASGTSNGRGGKGNIYTWAGGNGNNRIYDVSCGGYDCFDDNANYDGYANSRYVFAIAASNNYGAQSSYSEDGANILVNAPSNGGSLGITTTDRTGTAGYVSGNYYNGFGGTSSAAPLAAGSIVPILQANPSLSWRDVRLILAQSAEKNNPSDSGWTTNAAGYHINHKYGFGRVDVTNAVNKAISWTNVGPEISTEASKSPNIPIPDNNANGISDAVSITQNISVEFVEIYFTANDHTYWGDLDIELISPSGTVSKLATKHYLTNAYGSQRYDNWLFGDVRHMGESSQGTWTLKVKDLWAGDVGTLQNWGIKIYGTEISGGGGGEPDYQLHTTVLASPDVVTSGNTSQVTVHVERQCGTDPADVCVMIDPLPWIPAEGASVTLSATGGTLAPTSGTTNVSGGTTATYTAPTVSTSTVYTISATASKTGYISGSGSDQITVNPVQTQTSSIIISSVRFDALGTDRSYNVNGEWVKVKNTGTTSKAMTGWSLTDQDGHVNYVLPTFTLGAGKTVTIYSGKGSNSATRLYMGYTTHVWNNSGDCAYLKDQNGNLIDDYCT